jgi:carbamoyltransferase
VYYYEDPAKKLSRISSTYLNFGLRGLRSIVTEFPDWVSQKVHVKRELRAQLAEHFGLADGCPEIEYFDHHQSHAAAAFFPSPYQQAAVLCVDGVGEWATTSAWSAQGTELQPLWEIRFPHSLGLLYSAMTWFCGFKVDSGEYKLMGLAPYGTPRHEELILRELIELKDDGSYWLNMDYFDYAVGDCMVSDKFARLFGGPRREPEGPFTQREFDLAASVQRVLEEAIVRLAKSVRHQTGHRHLCLAGGVALNCVANGKLLAEQVFDDIWVQPAAGDSGGALGAALAGWHVAMKNPRSVGRSDSMQSSLLGPGYSDAEIETLLSAEGAVHLRIPEAELCSVVADLIADGHVVGWFQGRMEFGPRALGGRSILGDPRRPTMQSVMNLKIKNRESFRPFAPAVLEEHAHEWFELDRASPYMLFVVGVHPSHIDAPGHQEAALTGIDRLKCVRSSIPAVTHVDHSARVQTVGPDGPPRFRQLLEAFHRKTGCPVLINTSFNVRGEPIVESPAQAYRCFMRTQMDYLVAGHCLLSKSAQPALHESTDWRTEFALD